MRDPDPENITGQKVQRHTFKHEINWGYVSLAIALLVVGWLLVSTFADSDDGDDGEEVSATL